AIIKKRPSRNINVQNFWLYIFGMIFNAIAIFIQDFDAVMNKGFFHGYSLITTIMILNHALSGIAVSMVMKYADNIVKCCLGLDILALHWEAEEIVSLRPPWPCLSKTINAKAMKFLPDFSAVIFLQFTKRSAT
ncbi:hypothetical protein CRG98_013080, partial [Punica granatum]